MIYPPVQGRQFLIRKAWEDLGAPAPKDFLCSSRVDGKKLQRLLENRVDFNGLHLFMKQNERASLLLVLGPSQYGAVASQLHSHLRVPNGKVIKLKHGEFFLVTSLSNGSTKGLVGYLLDKIDTDIYGVCMDEIKIPWSLVDDEHF